MKAAIITLGCKVNYYESEVIKSTFISHGYELVTESELPDVIVINTCTVTNQADAKSRKVIRHAKTTCPKAILVVCGCSSQNHQTELSEMGIDILIGNKEKTNIIKYIEDYKHTKIKIKDFYDLKNVPFEDMQVTNFEDRTRAFVKIQDGCNNYCSYCIIPYMRGTIRSKDINAAYQEIESLVNNGFKEIVLTGIHTGSYGNGTDYDLVDLISKISQISKLERIRISSIEATEINDKFLNELKVNNKICNHLHIPIQSGSNAILHDMNRKYNIDEYIEIINKIRKIRPEINITTDLIVGFPTETQDNFEETINNLKLISFGKIHVFPYSKRDNTVAAKMKNIVSDKEKKERTHQVLILSDKLENKYYSQFINHKLDVLIEEVYDTYSIGHTSNYIKVFIDSSLKHNEEYSCLITSVDGINVKGIVTK